MEVSLPLQHQPHGQAGFCLEVQGRESGTVILGLSYVLEGLMALFMHRDSDQPLAQLEIQQESPIVTC